MRPFIFALAVALAACGSSQDTEELAIPEVEPGPDIEATQAARPDAGEVCPVSSPGVAITARNVTGGIELTLIGEPDRAEPLRALAGALVADGGVDPGALRGYPLPGDRIPINSVLEDVPGGVRAVVAALVPEDIDRLRQVVRDYADRLRAGECPGEMAVAQSADEVDH